MASRVLDAGAFYAGLPFASRAACHTTPAILGEVGHVKGRHGMVDALVGAGRLVPREPGAASSARARAAAEATGDAARLSAGDLSVLALCLDLGDAELVTDDYAVSNVGAFLGIRVSPVATAGIRRAGRWTQRCPGCGAECGANAPECPRCGGRPARRLAAGGGPRRGRRRPPAG